MLQEAELENPKNKNSSKAYIREFNRFSSRSATKSERHRPVGKADEPKRDKASMDGSWTGLKA